MTETFAGLKPDHLWKHFAEILKIPHSSGNEKALGDYVLGFASKIKLEAHRDRTGNVLVRKPGTKGRENSPAVILQGHMDMVCEENSDTVHDFAKDPIEALRDGDWIRAKGTTLGADNGIGLAASLAVMEDDSLTHNPLEFLFTVEEETGLTGANKLEPGFLKGRYLLNLDSEDEGEFTIGCAGGADTQIFLPLSRSGSAQGRPFTIKVSGMRGGHSGVDINIGRANAIKALSRVLWQVGKSIDFRLVSIEGGNLRNAIPREAWAVVDLDPSREADLAKDVGEAFNKIKFEYKAVDPQAVVSVGGAADPGSAPLTPGSQKTLVNLLFTLPHGVLAMHPEMKALVETSTNLAVIRTGPEKAEIVCSTRSSIASSLESVRNSIAALSEMSGVERLVQEPGYPGWTPNLASPLLKTMKALYSKTFGKDALVSAIHAGLECGIIGEKYPWMDMISFGPTIKFPHSPDEKLEVPSVEKFWSFLKKVLEELA